MRHRINRLCVEATQDGEGTLHRWSASSYLLQLISGALPHHCVTLCNGLQEQSLTSSHPFRSASCRDGWRDCFQSPRRLPAAATRCVTHTMAQLPPDAPHPRAAGYLVPQGRPGCSVLRRGWLPAHFGAAPEPLRQGCPGEPASAAPLMHCHAHVRRDRRDRRLEVVATQS